MNTPSMETMFLVMSGVILISGVLYWFWSHIQLTQNKMKLLENAVIELRNLISTKDTCRDNSEPLPLVESGRGVDKNEPEHESGVDKNEPEHESGVDKNESNESNEEDGNEYEWSLMKETSSEDDLRPGGQIDVGVEKTVDIPTYFAEPPQSPAESSKPTAAEALETMPVRELRRLAEQRGLSCVSDMKKKELIAALRQQVTKHEKSLDLTDVIQETEHHDVPHVLPEEEQDVVELVE